MTMFHQPSYTGDVFSGWLTAKTAPDSAENVGTDFVYVDDDFWPMAFDGALSLGRWKMKVPLRLESNGWEISAPVHVENVDYERGYEIDLARLRADRTYSAGMSQLELALVEVVRCHIAAEWDVICTIADRDVEGR